ncbi:hypothetical protein [Olleya sp. Bg11-27]|uniref:hypothetical protein n=1 Tax=Olleya sp. Bg11-27 TaxID=2058135 RepID=UPI000C31B032|nr:hypothetical protein [Olleya sp. Bg11-27]AUC74629.1 hypothetical protein CW732_02625 [Olleya sp. Bg11-27]
MRIKKIVKRAAISISVLLLIFKGILMYRDYVSYHDVIHKNADHIVKVRVDGILQTIALNAVVNPSFYLKKENKKDSVIEEKDNGKGVSIPANVFLYTIKEYSKKTLFASLKISDTLDFKNYIESQFHITAFEITSRFTVGVNKDEKIQIAFNDKQCVVVYNPNKEDVNQVFVDLLNDGKTLDSSDPKWSAIKEANSHINYLTKNNTIDLDFKSGQVVVNGNVVLPVFLDVPKTLKGTRFSKDASITLDLNVLSTLKYISLNHNNFTIDTDSLNAYYKGHLALEVTKSTMQIDSIISYEYNDDFEKVETLTAVEKEVPEINIEVTSDGSKLYKYLENKAIINNGRLNKEVFPLYQLKVDSTENGLFASTNLKADFTPEDLENVNVLALNIDFKKLQEQNYFPMLNTYLEKLLTLEVNGTNSLDETIAIDGLIQLKNKEINALAQFFINAKE